MEISPKNIGFGLFILVAVLILVNIFVIMPRMSMEPVQTSFVEEEPFVESKKPDGTVMTIDTLAAIRQTGGDEGGIARVSEDAGLRNPFFWPEEKSRQEKAKVTGADKSAAAKPGADKSAADKSVANEPEADKPQLRMVIIGKGRKQAILDDVFISEGDMFHGYLVKNIRDNEVILADKFGDLSIILGSGEETEEPSLPSGGLIER